MSVSGVYMLTRDCGEVVYVGRSGDVDARISVHLYSDKDFSGYTVIECEGYEQKVKERELIRLHNPIYNKCMHNKMPNKKSIIRLNDVDDNVSELITDAANRLGMKKHAYINKQLEKLAAKEYEQQQKDSANE